MRTILVIMILIISGCNHSNPISNRAPSEQELQSFIETMGINVLAKKLYSDYAIILGENSVYSLSILNNGKPQYLGSSWERRSERIDVTAVTQQSPFIGVIINRKDIIEQGKKLKIIFEDNSTVDLTMNDEKAFIIDHPFGKITNTSKVKVKFYNSEDRLIYENTVS